MTYSFDVINPPVIKVDMAVSRCQTFGKEPLAQVWGHVGDYEISVWLSLNDATIQRLLQRQNRRQVKRRKPPR